jgi:hypothetical protein
MQLYVKKLTSLNPRKYKFISLSNAVRGYTDYAKEYKGIKLKDFTNWLNTEI